MKYQEAVETWINGNRSDFREWAKETNKVNLVRAIEYYSCVYNHGEHIVNELLDILSK